MTGRMKPNTQANKYADAGHRVEHDETSLCQFSPRCLPLDSANVPNTGTYIVADGVVLEAVTVESQTYASGNRRLRVEGGSARGRSSSRGRRISVPIAPGV
ncbi:hypothetical protein [Streptomyces gardneri]|uniref:hypothetical protein n=1 Tax=Streptomyces gardneri TaxID=66892 RepID=UPI00367FFE2A